jgi:6-phosphogluconolactonase
VSHTGGVCNPSYLAIGAGGDRLYACTESRMLQKGSVSAFRFHRNSGRLQLINKVSSGGDNPAYVSVTRSGKWVAVANYSGGSLSVYPVLEDGGLRPLVQNVRHFGHGTDPLRQEKPHVHSALFSPDDKYLYVQDLGLDRITIGPFDEAAPEPAGKPATMITTAAGGGPRHLVFHPNKKYAYLIEEMGGSVDVYRYNATTGGLDSLQRIAAHPDTARGPFRSADIHVSPDGRFLYASNRAESTIAIFLIDPATGMLKPVGYASTLGKEPRNFTLDPTGKWLLVANQESNSIVIFSVDRKTGMLHQQGQGLVVPAPTCLKME